MFTMRKFMFLCLCMLAVATTSAQSPFGVKAGFGGAYLMEDLADGVDQKLHSDFYIGVFTEINLGKGLLLQPELVYSRQGAKYDSETVLENSAELLKSQSIVRLGYLNIPILLKYEITKGLFINVGPQFGINLSGKYESVSQYSVNGVHVDSESEDGDVKDLTICDVSLVAGLEYMITPRLDVSARYNVGLTNITTTEDVIINNAGFQVGLGFRIFN